MLYCQSPRDGLPLIASELIVRQRTGPSPRCRPRPWDCPGRRSTRCPARQALPASTHSLAWHDGLPFRDTSVLCADMAKPKSTFDLASSATGSSSHSHTHETASSYHPRRRAHLSPLRPSPNLIALLATVAASSAAADGRPLSPDSRPPDFLCPFLPARFANERASSSRYTLDSDQDQDQPDVLQSIPTPTRVRRKRNLRVPDKYVQDEDGRWRQEHSWSLYGSTYCDVSNIQAVSFASTVLTAA